MNKETCFLGESNPITTCAMFLKEVFEGDIFIGRPWPSFDEGFVTAWSPSHGLHLATELNIAAGMMNNKEKKD